MKRGLTAVLAGALAAVLLVPAAAATPGNGNGNGPPAWAGGENGGGKPDWAGSPAGEAAPRAPGASSDEADGEGPKHMNPAWVCKFEREQMGAEAFADEYGENENSANAFGKCAAREAHDRDGVTTGGEDPPPAAGDEETPVPGDPPETELPASTLAFLRYLWPFLF